MILTRLARKWWVAPLLLPMLLIDLHAAGHGECRVQRLIERLFPGPSDCILRPYAYVDFWADGDARVMGENGYRTRKPRRDDAPIGQVTVRWGGHVDGFIAPCEAYDFCAVQWAHPEPMLGIDIVSGVGSAMEQAGFPLSADLRAALQPEGLSTAPRFLWWGAAHDLAVVPLWVVAFGAVGYRLVALVRWVERRSRPVWRCVDCGYDLRGLRAGTGCPECGRGMSRAA